MDVPTCRHIRTNGVQCRAPKLTDGGSYCFFHNRLNRRHTGYRHTELTRGYLVPGHHVQLTALEDRESVQVALSVVINALATGQLETKRATALLYGLQLASMNAANLNFDPYAPKVVRSAESLPDGLDLAAPGATVNVTEDRISNRRNDDDDDEEEDEDDEDDDEQYNDDQQTRGNQEQPEPERHALPKPWLHQSLLPHPHPPSSSSALMHPELNASERNQTSSLPTSPVSSSNSLVLDPEPGLTCHSIDPEQIHG